jgi:hypothetical protein
LSLIKKIIFSVFVAVSLVLAVWAYKALQQNKKPSREVLAVMPDSCILYCSTKNFTDLSIKLNSQNLIFNKWKSLGDIKNLSETIDLYDSLIYNNELIASIVKDNMIHFASYPSANGVHWLIGFSLKELKQEKELAGVLEKIFVKKDENEFVINGKHKLKISQGVAVISDSDELLQTAFGAGNKLSANKLFTDQLDAIGKNETMRLYVNEVLFLKYSDRPLFRINELLNAREIIANVKFNPNEIIVNGNYEPGNQFLQTVIRSQEPVTMGIFEQLPFGTNCFRSVALSFPEEFQKVMETRKENLEFWQTINDKALYKVNNDLYNCVNDHIVEFSSFQNKALLVNLNDTAKAQEVLKQLSSSDSLFNEVRVFKLKPLNVIEGMFGDLFNVKAVEAFVLNEALYFTESASSTQEIISALKNNSTLSSNETFMNYADDNLNGSCNYMYYVAPNMNRDLVKSFANIEIDKNKELIENLSDANLMVSKQYSTLKFRMQLNYQSPSSENIPNLLWQCALDSGATQQPFLFVNHSTKENEITIQDRSKQLYLINSTGKILWKKKINEIIRSQIYTVDIFKNNKYQLLFNTDNYLHLIDRNGKYVDGYPIKLSSPATNALSLIDYEGKRDYRVFIACKNHLIYNYTLYGVRSEGFKPYRTDATVKLPVRFVRVGESDYLVTIDDGGMIHAFSRKGDSRIGFKNRAVEGCQDFALVSTNNVNRTFLYYVDDRNNLINRVSFTDKKDVIKLKTDLTDARIVFQDVNDDQTPDFTAQSFSGIYAYDINGTLLYTNSKLNGNSKAYVASVDSKKMFYEYDELKRIIVMSSNASMQVQVLASGTLPGIFNLYKDGKMYMLYVNEGKLLCNLLK